jgi:hypothetical protein
MKTILSLAFLVLSLSVLCVFSTQIDFGARDIFEFCELNGGDTDDVPLSFSTHSTHAWESRVSLPFPGLSGGLENHEQIYTCPLLAFLIEKPPRFI